MRQLPGLPPGGEIVAHVLVDFIGRVVLRMVR